MAPRRPLRIEPYNNDAVDADSDGIVQEDTAWERPAGTRLLDALGQAIRNGMTSQSRPSGIRVVDRDGNPVAYKPRATPVGKTPKPRSALGPTLGERQRTLGEMIPSLGQTIGTLEDRRKPKPVRVSPDFLPAREGILASRTAALARMNPAEVARQGAIAEKVRQGLDKSGLNKLDKESVQALALGGAYWATYLFNGGTLGNMINDFTTGVGDANLTEQLDVLWQMYAVGGLAGLAASMKGGMEKFGITSEQFQAFGEQFGQLMDYLKVGAGNLSEKVVKILEEIMDSIKSLFGGSAMTVAKVAFTDLEIKAARPLRIEPYRNDAIDADNDGIVQERTAWERPAGTRLLSELGEEIADGLTSPRRPKGMRVVDRDGNTIDYKPSYEKGDTKFDPKNVHPQSALAKLRAKRFRRTQDAKPRQAEPPKKFTVPEFKVPLMGDVMMSKPGFTSKDLFDEDRGRYVKERRTLHRSIVGFYLQKSKPRSPESKEEKTVWFLGGGAGSGKSSAIANGSIGVPSDLLRVDPDEIKDFIPEYRAWLANGDGRASEFVHEESKHIFEHTVQGLVQLNADFVYDTTGNGSYEKMARKVQDLRRNGHVVKARYMTIDIDEALRRAEIREQTTGRRVPKSQVIHNHQEVSTNVIRGIADGLFDELELYDNNGSQPTKILEVKNGDVRILDPDAVDRFMAKSPSLSRSPGKTGAGVHEDVEKGKSASNVVGQTSRIEARQAWSGYLADDYKYINYLLRDGGDGLPDEEYNETAQKINDFDEYFDHASFSVIKPVKAYRGTREYLSDDVDVSELSTDELYELLGVPEVGTKYSEDAYSSATESIDIAESFALGQVDTESLIYSEGPSVPVVVEINIPPGLRMLPGTTYEKEVILERKTRFRVIGVTTQSTAKGEKYQLMRVVALPPYKKPEPLELAEIDDGY